LSASAIDFTGPVTHTTVYLEPRNLRLTFSSCSLDSGFNQLLSLDPEDVSWLSLTSCHLTGPSTARVNEGFMEADTLDGSLAWAVHEVWIEHCWFRGGAGTAIALSDSPRPGLAAYNRIENYGTAMVVQDADPYVIQDNAISHCGVGISLQFSTTVDVIRNA